MSHADTARVRQLLSELPCHSGAKSIVAAGIIGRIDTFGLMVDVEFKPHTTDQKRISDMEHKIRDVLRGARFADIQIRRAGEPEGAGVGGHAAHHDHGHHHHDHDHGHKAAGGCGEGCGCADESRLMTPLQAEFLEDGELPEDDLLATVLGRADVAAKAGYAPGGPNPLSGPREDFAFDCNLKVLQWDINPHDAAQTTRQHEIKVGDWDYRVWWQAHPRANLLYVSMQAMREDWITHEDASPHPVGRSEAVNLVFDQGRDAVVAIYGTVRDFRPFVKAFSLAYERDTDAAGETQTPQGGKA